MVDRANFVADVVPEPTDEFLRTGCAVDTGHLSMVLALIWMVPAVQPDGGRHCWEEHCCLVLFLVFTLALNLRCMGFDFPSMLSVWTLFEP
jgi:hypothetical protein